MNLNIKRLKAMRNKMKKFGKCCLVALIIDSQTNSWKENYFREEISLHEFLKRDQLLNIFE
jgi:hypothetical protein